MTFQQVLEAPRAPREPRRPRGRVPAVLVVLALAWGALAFGAVYPWAYRPLLVGVAAIGLYGLFTRRSRRLAIDRPVAIGLALVALGIGAQLVPLPRSVLADVSPAADRFLRAYDFSYAAAEVAIPAIRSEVPTLAPAIETSPTSHPLSIRPSATARALLFLAALGIFLIGLARALPAVDIGVLVRGLALFAVLMAIVAMLQKAVSGEIVTHIYGFWQPRYRGNPFGPFVNRNHYAAWMVMALPLVLGYVGAAIERAVASETTWRNRVLWLGSPEGSKVLLVVFASLIMSLSLVVCASRSGAICFGIATIVGGWFVLRAQAGLVRRIAVMAGLVLLVVIAAEWAGTGVLVERFNRAGSETGGRLAAWRDTIAIIRDYPVTGTGFNTYGIAMFQYQAWDPLGMFLAAHNDYLQLAAEGGLLVGLPIAALIAIFTLQVRRRFVEDAGDRSAYWIRAGAVTGLITIACQALVEFGLQIPGNAALFAVLAAVAVHKPLPPATNDDRRARHVAPSPW